jgi:hypothetical protein
VDGALYSCRNIGAYRLESSFGARVDNDRGILLLERDGECFMELCVLLSPQDGVGNLGVSVPGSYDHPTDSVHRAGVCACRMAFGAVCGLGHFCVVSELSGVDDKSVVVSAN